MERMVYKPSLKCEALRGKNGGVYSLLPMLQARQPIHLPLNILHRARLGQISPMYKEITLWYMVEHPIMRVRKTNHTNGRTPRWRTEWVTAEEEDNLVGGGNDESKR